MSETSSPLGRFADAVASIVTVAVILTFLAVHGLAAIAPTFGLPVSSAPTTELDTVAVATLGYVLGGIGLGGRPAPAPAAP